MQITKTINGDNAVLTVEGWLDTRTAPELGKAADELPEDVKNLELDFSKLEYISSAGLRQVVALHKKMDKLSISNASAEILDVFRMTGFDKRIDIR